MKLQILATFLTALLLSFSGCGTKPTPKKEATIDKTLPLISLTQKGTIADIKSIALEWELINDKRVEGIYIYRVALDEKKSATKKDDYYHTIDNRFSTHFLDTDIEPNSNYSYYFKTYTKNAESINSRATVITSLDVIDSVTWIYSAGNMPRSAKIIWRPHTNQKVKAYLIQRRTLKDDVWTDLATVEGRLQAEFIDTKLKDKFTYIYRIRALTYDGITSKPSKEVRIITKALPKGVKNLHATKNLPRAIELTWDKSTAKDFKNYNVYRASSIDGSYELLAKILHNTYIDDIQKDAKQYFYRVSVVDSDGLESDFDEKAILGSTLNKPKTPALIEAKLFDGQIKISWSELDDRVKNYVVQKRFKTGMFNESITEFEDIKALEFIDVDIQEDKAYFYQVYSVDKNGIRSEPSIEVELKVGKIMSEATISKSVNNNSTKSTKKEVIIPLNDFN